MDSIKEDHTLYTDTDHVMHLASGQPDVKNDNNTSLECVMRDVYGSERSNPGTLEWQLATPQFEQPLLRWAPRGH